MRKIFVLFAFGWLILFSSFTSMPDDGKQPGTITRISTVVNGKNREETVILLKGSTSREELIHTCSFLAKENVQLIFDKLTIGRSFLGLIGKQRIRIAEGMIRMPEGSSQRFKAGGVNGFRFIKIQYANNTSQGATTIEMIEIVD